jgi:type II secretory pathway component PulK
MHPDPRSRTDEQGMALIMVLIFTVLLYAMVSELVTTAQTARLTGLNDLLLARMRSHMDYVEQQVEQLLIDDLAAAGGEGDGAGGLGGIGGLGGLGGAPPSGSDAGGDPSLATPSLGEGEEEPDPATIADGSQDAWYQPTAYADGDITTYVWVEDENRKFNILCLVSPDEDFAEESRQRFARLVDSLREDTEFDLSNADGDFMARNIIDWIQARTRGENLPRPPLKSDDEERSELSLPLHLDELLLLQGIDEDLYYDKVLDSRVIPGLASVLTVWTSLAFDPGDPDNPNQPQPDAGAGADPTTTSPDSGDPGAAPLGGDSGGGPPPPVGVGVKINVNTAPRAVLRCLFTQGEVPDSVIDAILRYRNEPIEEDGLLESSLPDDYLGDVRTGEGPRLQMFTDLAQLDDIPEFQNLSDPAVKGRFQELLTVNSDVFSVHFAALHRRNEEARTFVLQRARSILVRLEGQEAQLHPIVILEERRGLRVMPVDFYEDDLLGLASEFDEMDAFSQEERAWNPFFLDFYRPKNERDEIFTYRERFR